MRVFSGILAVLLAVGGGFLVGRGRMPRSSDADSGRHVVYWVDPMHPAYKSNHPGTAPDCGMPLEPVYADSVAASIASDGPGFEGKFDDEIRHYHEANVGVVKVEPASETYKLHIPGRVVPDETRIYNVNAGVDGFVKETYGDVVGHFVKKDQRLAAIYSPEFLTVLGGYLSASERTQNAGSKEGLAAAQGVTGVENWADRLRNLGVSDAQITELKETRKIPEDIYVVSPVNGFILSRRIATNERFERHTEFYRIADLGWVWVTANVSAADIEYLRPGTVAHIVVPGIRSTFLARVSSALPQVDSATGIWTVRLEADNSHFALRPETFVNLYLSVHAPAGLTVPREAIMDSGLQKRVFVELANGTFQSRTVETGWHLEDRVQIIGGLAEGERVAASASFMVDSEARLKSSSLQAPHTPNRGAATNSMGSIATGHATVGLRFGNGHELASITREGDHD